MRIRIVAINALLLIWAFLYEYELPFGYPEIRYDRESLQGEGAVRLN